MRRSASEIIRSLEVRVARLERQAMQFSPQWISDTLSIEEAYKTFKVRAIKMVNSLDKYMSEYPQVNDLFGLKEPFISERFLRGVFEDLHQRYASDKSVVADIVFMRIFIGYVDSITYQFKKYSRSNLLTEYVSSFLKKYLR